MASSINSSSGTMNNASMLVAAAASSKSADASFQPAGDEYEETREQDRYLPMANIARIM